MTRRHGTRERLVDVERRHERARSPVREAVLWAGVLVAPAAWALALLVGYALTGPPCTDGAAAALVALTVAAALAAAVGALVARRARHRLRDAPAPHGSGAEDEREGGVPTERERDDDPRVFPRDDMPHRSANDRRRLMALGGMILGALTVAILVGHGIALLVLGPCR